jgi:SAM-dependent methyltransferase
MLAARYHWAARHAAGADVLEAACGAGMGLPVLAARARSVVAGDLDPRLLAEARAAAAGDPRITVRALDAQQLPFPAASFDEVLLFEAVYYLPRAEQFFAEAHRVLRPGGHLRIVTVNREWRGFNPSPHAVRYFSAAELHEALSAAGFRVVLEAAFPEQPSASSALIGGIRKLAVRLHLIPRTMSGKALLKRLFMGRLSPIPERLEAAAEPEALQPAEQADLARYRVLYATARKELS